MSFAAIKHVTHALRTLLRYQLRSNGFAGAEVTILPPGNALPEIAGVNLYLYRVLESPFTKNDNWRGDRKPTPPSSRPALGLQLFYLVTPLTPTPDNNNPNDGEETHSVLGLVMLTLQEFCILNDIHLPEITLQGGTVIPPIDADRDLPDFIRNSFEKLKVTLQPTNVDEISRIWATLNQPYRLSVAYEVSIVELTPTPPSPGGGIVLVTGVNVITLDPPRLTELDKASGSLVTMDPDMTLKPVELTIAGFGLRFPGQSPLVRVGGQSVDVKEEQNPTDRSLTVILPKDVNGGPQVDVRVTLNSRTSTPLTFTVAPWIARMKPFRTSLEKDDQGNDPKLEFTGSGFGTAPQAIRYEGPKDGASQAKTITQFEPGGTDSKATIILPADLANGLYEMRLVAAGGGASNVRTLEVVPFVAKVDPTVENNVHRLTVTGARLKGKSIRFVLDGVSFVAPENADANQFVFLLGRKLDFGPHQLTMIVDGHSSRPKEFKVP